MKKLLEVRYASGKLAATITFEHGIYQVTSPQDNRLVGVLKKFIVVGLRTPLLNPPLFIDANPQNKDFLHQLSMYLKYSFNFQTAIKHEFKLPTNRQKANSKTTRLWAKYMKNMQLNAAANSKVCSSTNVQNPYILHQQIQPEHKDRSKPYILNFRTNQKLHAY